MGEGSDTIRVLGHDMLLDPPDRLGLRKNGIYEPFPTRLVQGWLREGYKCVDAGAHIGYYTLLMAETVGPKGTVYAFEPEPSHYAILQDNVMLNGYQNVKSWCKALGHKPDRMKLHLCPSDNAAHSLLPPLSGEAWPHIHVPIITLDSHVPIADFIKIDVEGYEHWVIEGAKKLLSYPHRMALLIEYWPSEIRRSGADPEAMLQYLASQGFGIWQIKDLDVGPLLPASIEELMAFEERGWVYVWAEH